MANSAKLRKAAQRFMKHEPDTHSECAQLLKRMAFFIKKTGTAEVAINSKDYTCYAIDK